MEGRRSLSEEVVGKVKKQRLDCACIDSNKQHNSTQQGYIQAVSGSLPGQAQQTAANNSMTAQQHSSKQQHSKQQQTTAQHTAAHAWERSKGTYIEAVSGSLQGQHTATPHMSLLKEQFHIAFIIECECVHSQRFCDRYPNRPLAP